MQYISFRVFLAVICEHSASLNDYAFANMLAHDTLVIDLLSVKCFGDWNTNTTRVKRPQIHSMNKYAATPSQRDVNALTYSSPRAAESTQPSHTLRRIRPPPDPGASQRRQRHAVPGRRKPPRSRGTPPRPGEVEHLRRRKGWLS